jgi:hypothetical protein
MENVFRCEAQEGEICRRTRSTTENFDTLATKQMNTFYEPL